MDVGALAQPLSRGEQKRSSATPPAPLVTVCSDSSQTQRTVSPTRTESASGANVVAPLGATRTVCVAGGVPASGPGPGTEASPVGVAPDGAGAAASATSRVCGAPTSGASEEHAHTTRHVPAIHARDLRPILDVIDARASASNAPSTFTGHAAGSYDGEMRAALAALTALSLLPVAACSAPWRDTEVPAYVSEDRRGDWEVFARRCSKCHALARPLQSGIDDDAQWRAYVARMRAQPGSGISASDEERILAFLRTYAAEQRRKRAAGRASEGDAGTAAPPALPADGGSP